MTREISRALGASGSAAFRMRGPGRAAASSMSAAMLAAAVGWSTPAPTVGEEQRRAAVEHAPDEHPLSGLPRSRAVDLGRPQHGDRDPAVQQYLLGGDLAGRIAFRAAVVPISGGHGGLVFPDRAAEVGVDRGVGVAAGPVHVDGLAGDQHGRRRVTGQGQQPGRVLRGETDAVHQQVGAGPEGGPQPSAVAGVRGDEPAACRSDVARHPGRITPGELDRPARGQQPPRGGPPDGASPADNDRPCHPATVSPSCPGPPGHPGQHGRATRPRYYEVMTRRMGWWQPQ